MGRQSHLKSLRRDGRKNGLFAGVNPQDPSKARALRRTIALSHDRPVSDAAVGHMKVTVLPALSSGPTPTQLREEGRRGRRVRIALEFNLEQGARIALEQANK